MPVDELPASTRGMLKRNLPGCDGGSEFRGDGSRIVGWATQDLREAFNSARYAPNPAERIARTLRVTNTVVNLVVKECLGKPSFFAEIKGKAKRTGEAVERYDELLAKSGAVVQKIVDSYRPENLVPKYLDELRANALIFLSKAEKCRLYIIRECEAALTYRRFFDTDVGRTKQLLQKYYPDDKRFWDHLRESVRIRNEAQPLLGTPSTKTP